MTQTALLTAIDLTAPILPGVGAAGLRLGADVATVAPSSLARFRTERIINTCIQAPTGVVRYQSEVVDFWATDGVIDQVVVRAGYMGTLAGVVRPAMTVAEVERAVGPLRNDGGGRLILARMPGISLSVSRPPGISATVAHDDHEDAADALRGTAVITAITVYQP